LWVVLLCGQRFLRPVGDALGPTHPTSGDKQ
jgi:hypothetical protein